VKRFVGRIVAARSDLFELAGFALLTVAAFHVSSTFGFAAAGIALVVIGLGSR
jgi:hypothetical protein